MFANQNIFSGHGPEPVVVTIPQNSSPRIPFTLVDGEGAAIDCVSQLSTQDAASYANWAATGGYVKAAAREAVFTDALFAVSATPVDPTAGTFTFQPPIANTGSPGIYLLEYFLFNSQDILVASNPGHLEIRESIAQRSDKLPGFSIARLRQRIRDTSPRSNRVLEECEFSLAEITSAASNAVSYYNEHMPFQDAFTTADFPWGEHLCLGVMAEIFQTAALWYIRNDLKIQTGGLAADDMGKGPVYMQMAENFRQRWEKWVVAHKRDRNIKRGWGTVGSGMYRSRRP